MAQSPDAVKRSMFGSNWNGPPLTGYAPRPEKHAPGNMARMIASRMGWDLDAQTAGGFDHLFTKKLSDTQAVVFVIHKETPMIIYDDINLFPSDALVTSLRLLLA